MIEKCCNIKLFIQKWYFFYEEELSKFENQKALYKADKKFQRTIMKIVFHKLQSWQTPPKKNRPATEIFL